MISITLCLLILKCLLVIYDDDDDDESIVSGGFMFTKQCYLIMFLLQADCSFPS